MNDIPSPNEQEEQPHFTESESEEATPQTTGTSRFGKLRKAIESDVPSNADTSIKNLPPQPIASPTPPPEPIPPGYAPQYISRPLKDRNIALILEILPGLFGLYGFGWMYSGNTGTGVMLLVGGLVWAIAAVIAAALTATAACFCTVPVNLVAVAVSATMLSNYTKKHPELFGR